MQFGSSILPSESIYLDEAFHKDYVEIFSDTLLTDDQFNETLSKELSESQIDKTRKVITAIVKEINMQKGYVLVDAGLKSECRIPLREFFKKEELENLKVGSIIKVYLSSLDFGKDCTILSKEKALREVAYERILEAYKNKEPIEGIIFAKTRSGLIVDIDSIICFLPGSQVDSDLIKDTSEFIGKRENVMVMHLDEKKRNIVVSRKAVKDLSRKEFRDEFLSKLKEGDVVDGYVKNITPYGAFINLGDIDGLLHVTDISWEKIGHPGEVLHIGQKVKVKVIKFLKEESKISVGMKQLEENPWNKVLEEYKVGSIVKGKITNVMNYGLFVKISSEIEGLVHLSEICWGGDSLKKMKENYQIGQEVSAIILEINTDKHRIALGIKQLSENPWEKFVSSHKAGDIIEGEIRNITNFGIFVGIGNDMDGLISLNDISWNGDGHKHLDKFKKGSSIKVVYLEGDHLTQKIRLGIKQLSEDPYQKNMKSLATGSVVECRVVEKKSDGILVELFNEINVFIKKGNLSIDSEEEKFNSIAINDKINAKITGYSEQNRKFTLSIKDYEQDLIDSYAEKSKKISTIKDFVK